MAKTHEPRDIDQLLAAELRAARAVADVSMNEVARRLGWHPSKTYTKFRGAQPCYLHDVVDLAHAMGTPAWKLLKAAEEHAGGELDTTPQARRCQYSGCGKLLPAGAHHRREYCDDECKRRSRLKGAQAERSCLWCGDPIPAHVDGRAKYCSEDHYKAAAVERRRTSRAKARRAK